MKKLPLEVLNDIFLLLHYKDKAKCMLVCRHWAYVIRTCSLLNTLHLSHIKNFEKLIISLQKGTFKKAQVERLILNLRLDEKFNINQISTLFPNLRLVYLLRSDQRRVEREEVKQLEWIPMEHIVEIVSHTLTCDMLASNLCSQLKILSVHANDYGVPGRALISLLKNAPCLSVLSMRAFEILFNDLELLHSILPYLHSLKLSQTRIVHDFVPTNIHPANSVKVFKFTTHCDIIQIKTEWLRYIKQKYTQLTEFQLVCPNSRFDQAIGNEGFHKQGMLPITQSIGARLSTLSVNIKDYACNFFKVLDDANCRIENLSFHTDLGATAMYDFTCSNQIQFIRTLVIDDADFKGFEWLKGLTNLEALTLAFKYKFNDNHEAIMDIIQFNSFLNMCSDKLESLVIKKVYLNVIIDQSVHHHIKHLSLCDVPMPEQMDIFVSTSLPHLRSLSLIFCGLYGNVFKLPEHHLILLEVAERFYFNVQHLLLVTEGKRQYYNADRTLREHTVFKSHSSIHDASLYPSTPQVNAWTDMVDITFICASVQRLFVLGY